MTTRLQTIDRPRVRPTGRAAVLAAIVTVLGVVSVVPVRAYLDGRARIAGLERQERALEQENADLRARIAKLYDPAELERLARECLGMVEPGEIAFIVVPEDGKPAPSSC